MKLVDSYMLQELGDSCCLVPVAQAAVEGKPIIRLNETGAFVAENLREYIHYHDLVRKMIDKFQPENDDELLEMKIDLCNFLESLRTHDLLELTEEETRKPKASDWVY